MFQAIEIDSPSTTENDNSENDNSENDNSENDNSSTTSAGYQTVTVLGETEL